MQKPELLELLSLEGLALLDSLTMPHSTKDLFALTSRLRKDGHSPGLTAAVLTQLKLRSKAQLKFGEFASRMLFTEAGLEQATRLPVAAHHAERFRFAEVQEVADLGCGIGADSLAFASLDLQVKAVEADEVTATIAAYNLAPFDNAEVVHGLAEDQQLKPGQGVYLDPARRSTGASRQRLMNPEDWVPSLDFVFEKAKHHPLGVKLSPAIDHALIPRGAEAQWISVDGEVVEAGLWFGPLRRPDITRSALVLRAGVGAELTASAPALDEPVTKLGRYLYNPDGAVIRAQLLGDLARSLEAFPVSEQIAYLSSDTLTETPFARSFEIIEVLPLSVKKLKIALAEREIGILEISKRGSDHDPALLRKELKLRGKNSATLILTRLEGKHAALLCQPVEAH